MADSVVFLLLFIVSMLAWPSIFIALLALAFAPKTRVVYKDTKGVKDHV